MEEMSCQGMCSVCLFGVGKILIYTEANVIILIKEVVVASGEEG